MDDWIDVSRAVSSGMPVWPGDPPWRYHLAASFERGDGVNVGAIEGSTHAGTHADAPLHVDPAGAGVDALPLDAFIGPAALLDLTAGEGGIALEEIETAIERAGGRDLPPRLLLRTGCDWSAGFPSRFRGLPPAAGAWCAKRRLRLLGTDAPSVDLCGSDSLATHRSLAAAGVMIVEGLVLADVEPGRYDLVALPLRWAGADASPVRAALRRREP